MSQYIPERLDGRAVNLAGRLAYSVAVAGSPAAAAETVIATVAVPTNVQTFQAVELEAWAAFTVGTSGVTAEMRIRQTNVNGTVVADSGLATVTAGNLYERSIIGADAAPGPGQVYVLTLQVGSGAAASTVSAVYFRALSI